MTDDWTDEGWLHEYGEGAADRKEWENEQRERLHEMFGRIDGDPRRCTEDDLSIQVELDDGTWCDFGLDHERIDKAQRMLNARWAAAEVAAAVLDDGSEQT
jgi:hypothetical protein